MIYQALIELIYLGGREALPADARHALRSAMLAELGASDKTAFIVSTLTVSTSSNGVVEVSAILQGTSPRHLTSPLEAITRLDASLDRSLIRTGLFEEFDVARKTLLAAPLEHGQRLRQIKVEVHP